MTFCAVNRTLTILDNFQKQVLTQVALKLMQDLLSSLPVAIEEIHTALNISTLREFHSIIKICACQLTKTIPHLVGIVKGLQNASHKEVSDFLIGKIRLCLLKVLSLAEGSSDEDEEPSDIFVKLMDCTVFDLKQRTFSTSGLKANINELLCQALTIAKLSNQEDYEEISASCKHVIATTAELIESPEAGEACLTTIALLSSLEMLERRVNVAVLRLFLHLASDSSFALKQVTLKCMNKRHKPRDFIQLSEDLDLLDLHCERIQLLGNFAVACSNDLQLKVKIRSCLASIDYCESFLRPTVQDVYTMPADYRKRGFFKFLVNEYQKEMKDLTHLIDCVVDTETFVQVTLDDIVPLSQDIKQNIENNIFNKRDAEVFLMRSIRLVKHLHSAVIDVSPHRPELFEAVRELESILKQYKICLRTNVLNLSCMQDVISRINAALHLADKISGLVADNRSTDRIVTNDFQNAKNEGNVTYPPEDDVLQPFLDRLEATPRMKSSFYAVTPKKMPEYSPRRIFQPVNCNIISEISDNIQDLFLRTKEESEETSC